MLRIRLARTGRKKLAHYRVVVSESDQTPAGGAAVQLGYYDPHTKTLEVDSERLQYYLDQGAQPSGRLVRLLQDRNDVTVPEHAAKNLVIKEKKVSEPEAGPEPETKLETEAEEPADTKAGDEAEEQAESGKLDVENDSVEAAESSADSGDQPSGQEDEEQSSTPESTENETEKTS